MTTIRVKAYERSKPEKKPDPLLPMIEARKAVLIGRYQVIQKKERSRLQRALFRLGRIWSA